jgi:hypothetical protein
LEHFSFNPLRLLINLGIIFLSLCLIFGVIVLVTMKFPSLDWLIWVSIPVVGIGAGLFFYRDKKPPKE